MFQFFGHVLTCIHQKKNWPFLARAIIFSARADFLKSKIWPGLARADFLGNFFGPAWAGKFLARHKPTFPYVH